MVKHEYVLMLRKHLRELNDQQRKQVARLIGMDGCQECSYMLILATVASRGKEAELWDGVHYFNPFDIENPFKHC